MIFRREIFRFPGAKTHADDSFRPRGRSALGVETKLFAISTVRAQLAPPMPLSSATTLMFAPVTDLNRAKAFYGEKLGLTLISETPFGLVFRAGTGELRLNRPPPPFKPQAFTIAGWGVTGISGVVMDLAHRGVVFLRVPEVPQDADLIWTAPNGDKVAWFKDPDGNILSVSQAAK
ncbi:hypothetical protein AYO41_00265 [Verrucomicrobia bacterium SCGC AG-212-E04]|nr:hypothetical protein AYO41_00265 [Verrucomicrobia bacterium SCGC AG-212-E04]